MGRKKKAMDRTIAKHLAKRGMMPTKPPSENLTFSERNPNFFKWFHESVMGFDSEEYRRKFWREAKKNGHTIGRVPYGLKEFQRRRDSRLEGIAIILELLVGGSALAIWLIRRMVDKHIQRLRRPTYYETERSRRLGLAEERRRIHKRRTTNAIPSNEELLSAFQKAKDSASDMIRFGSLIEDLECYVDNTPYFRNGHLVGRRGGIRRYLEREIPELYARYKTVMKYKALSKKFRQATGVADPIPAASLLPKKKSEGCENSVRNEFSGKDISDGNISGRKSILGDISVKESTHDNISSRKSKSDDISDKKIAENQIQGNAILTKKILAKEILAKQILAKEILEACEGSIVSLAAQLELRTSPNYTPPIIAIRTSSNMSPMDISTPLLGFSNDTPASANPKNIASCRNKSRNTVSHKSA